MALRGASGVTGLPRSKAAPPRRTGPTRAGAIGGLTLDDTAATLGVSAATVSREWTVARRWLRRELARSGAPVRRSSEEAR